MFITFHSYKGGTGKTLLSVNLAMTLTAKGKKVCLLDLDLRAPSLSSTFNNKAPYWVNDYLSRLCDVENILTESTPDYINDGSLFVGLANPSTEAIREMSAKDRKWEMEALGRLLSLKDTLLNELGFDYIICDSSPGLQYSSINTIVVADIALVVTSVDRSDVAGTQRMLHDLYDLYEKKTGVIVNKVPQTVLSGKIPLKLDTHKLPLIEMVPCSCDILNSAGEYLFAFNNTQHPLNQSMDKIVNKIQNW
ncbi:MAG: MinD/ParA family protein [Candidatus Bathyarchaeota archaeon]|nr:MinD/ParA family protein [Candidatus Bathyarchaeota archaeon]